MPNIIGLDLGTSTISGILLDIGHREVLSHPRIRAQAQRLNDSAVRPRHPSRAEQDPRRLRVLALEVLTELASHREQVDGIAVTGQMHGVLCLDAAGEPLTPLISWQDQRTAEPLSDGSTTLQRIHARLEKLDWLENGCRLVHGYGAATLFWLTQQGALPADTHRVCTLPDWIAGQLTGKSPATDPSLAASWGLYSLVKGAWNVGFLRSLGLDAQLLPPVRSSAEQLGCLLTEIARSVGLSDGIPVLNALGDSQANFLGSVTEPARSVLVNLGTGGQVCWMRPGFELPTPAVETRPLPSGRFLRVGASLCGGAAYAWLNDTVRAWLAEFGMHLDRQVIYERLRTLATGCKDTSGLRVRPTFLGSRMDPVVTRGTIEGITPHNLRLGPLARATLIGMVGELRTLYDSASGSYPHSRVVATGGGVSMGPLLPSIIEEQFGLPVEVPRLQETAAVGVAILAASRGLERRQQSPSEEATDEANPLAD